MSDETEKAIVVECSMCKDYEEIVTIKTNRIKELLKEIKELKKKAVKKNNPIS